VLLGLLTTALVHGGGMRRDSQLSPRHNSTQTRVRGVVFGEKRTGLVIHEVPYRKQFRAENLDYVQLAELAEGTAWWVVRISAIHWIGGR